MADPADTGEWRGTSDAPATLLRRADTTPMERWTMLAELVEFAAESGSLARARKQAQDEADAWAHQAIDVGDDPSRNLTGVPGVHLGMPWAQGAHGSPRPRDQSGARVCSTARAPNAAKAWPRGE